MKVREKAILPDQLYSNNKDKIKKVYKAYGLKFNQGALHTNQLFLWQTEGTMVQGFFTKDDDGLTVHSELVITAKERTQLFDDLKELVEELGGKWEIVEEEELQKEEDDATTKAIEDFEHSMWSQLFNEERKARKKGFEHCPILKALITKLLTERHEKFGLQDLMPYDVLAEVYATIDSEVSE